MSTVYFKTSHAMIKDFAKANNISPLKLATFVESVTHAISSELARGFMENTNDQSQRVREYIERNIPVYAGKKVTVKEISKELGIEPYIVGNNLRMLERKNPSVRFVGYADKNKGERGRKERVWQVG